MPLQKQRPKRKVNAKTATSKRGHKSGSKRLTPGIGVSVPFIKSSGKKQTGFSLTLLERVLIVIILAIFIGSGYFADKNPGKQWVNHDNAASIFPSGQVSPTDFIEQIGCYAQDNYENSGILPSVVIAQAILESEFGQSDLASTYNNLYGYKAHGQELAVALPTLEYVDGEWVEVNDYFKVYNNWEASVRDHGKLMREGTAWDTELYSAVITATNYREATLALQEAGYATDPAYSQKLNTIIEEYQLEAFDLWQ